MLWLKCFHLLGVIAWLAGIFYLPRIFVHYAEGQAAGEDVRRLVIMGRRLFNFMTIMAIVALTLGLWLMLYYGFSGNWLTTKLAFVCALLLYHFGCQRLLGRMERQEPLPAPLRLRFLNEAALLIVVPILILVIVKPF